MGEQRPETRNGARAIVAAFESAGVALVPSVADAWIGWLMEDLRRSPTLRVVDVVREEEAIAIACGAALGGARAAVVIPNAGLLNSGAIIGSLIQLYRIPCFFLVSDRGDVRDPTYYHGSKGRATEATLDAWTIRHAKAAGAAGIGEQIHAGFRWIEEARAPFVLLFRAEDLA